MSLRTSILLGLAAGLVVAAPGCRDPETDGDVDADVDGDVDGDADGDVDGDVDGDADADTDPPPVGDGSLGSACRGDDDCESGQCIPDEDDGWIDGYCVETCENPDRPCGEGGMCVDGLGAAPLCMQGCDEPCREGYACVYFTANPDTTFCYPYCTGDPDCPTGYRCDSREMVCLPAPPCSAAEPEGRCPSGQTCVAGECEDECSASAPAGYCPAGFACEGGHCMSTSGCGSWECTSGSTACNALVPMPGSYSSASTEARAAGYYITTDSVYAFLPLRLTLLWQWAMCEMHARFPAAGPLALADMTTSDGTTPGCELGSSSCRHPEGSTHTGRDIDTAYYQTDGANNYQCICGDGTARCWNGYPDEFSDGYFCTTEENIVDFEMQSELMRLVHSTGLLRVVGVDQTLVDDLRPLLPAGLPLGYGEAGGWAFHHHHLHWSFI